MGGGQGGELPELAGFSLYLGSRKLGIKGKQNDWAVPRLDLSVLYMYMMKLWPVCDCIFFNKENPANSLLI